MVHSQFSGILAGVEGPHQLRDVVSPDGRYQLLPLFVHEPQHETVKFIKSAFVHGVQLAEPLELHASCDQLGILRSNFTFVHVQVDHETVGQVNA